MDLWNEGSLDRRLSRLGICPPVRGSIGLMLEHSPGSVLYEYLAVRLPRLERALSGPGVGAWAEVRNASATGEDSLLRGLLEEVDEARVLESLVESLDRGSKNFERPVEERLLCALHLAALPISAPNTQAVGVGLVANNLATLFGDVAAVELLESHTGLRGLEYGGAAWGKALTAFCSRLEPNNAAVFVQWLAERLGFAGRSRDGALLLESHCDIRGRKYGEEAWRTALTAFAAQLGSDNAASFMRSLAIELGLAGRDREGALLLEWHSGLLGLDYGGAAWTEAFAAFAARLERNNAAFFVKSLADRLGFAGRSWDGALLLEWHAGLLGLTYGGEAWRESLAAFAIHLEPNNAANYMQSLSVRLGLAGRHQDGALLLERHAGLLGLTCGGEAWGEALSAFAARLRPNNAIDYLRSLSAHLEFAQRNHEGALLLESHAGLRGLVYGEEAWRQALTDFAARLAPNNAANYVQSLSVLLRLAGRHRDGALLLERHAGLLDLDYGGEAWRNALSAFAARLEPNSVSVYVRSLAECLGSAGLHRNGALLLETHAGLSALADGEETWRNALSAFAARLDPNNAVSYLSSLFDLHTAVDRESDSGLLLDWLVLSQPGKDWDFFEAVAPGNVAVSLPGWFAHLGTRDDRREAALGLAERSVQFLRASLRLPGVSLEDRRLFVQRTTALIVELRRVGAYWADVAEASGDEAEGTRLRRRVHIWDLELRQRILLEKMILGRWVVAGDDGASLVEPSEWPYRQQDLKRRIDDLPDHLALAPASDRPPPCLALSTTEGATGTVEAVELQEATNDDERREAERIVERGLDEAELAKRLGADGVMLRLTFDSEGRGVRSLLRSRDGELDVVASRVVPDGRRRLAWIAAKQVVRNGLTFAYRSLGRNLEDLADDLQACGGSRKGLIDVLKRYGDRPAFASLTFDLASSVLPLLSSRDDEGPPEEWESLLERLNEDLERLGAPDYDRVAHLHAVTGDALAAWSAVFAGDDLAAYLDPDRTDLTVQADGPWSGAPIALLDAKGQELCRRVRSLRVSLSPLADELQRRTDERARARGVAAGVLALSAFEENDPEVVKANQKLDQAALAAVPFHLGQKWAAKTGGAGYLGVAAAPRAGAAWLQGHLRGENYYRSVAIMAHGMRHARDPEGRPLPGMILPPDGLWTGAGRLDRAEWLMLASCSMGSVNGELDADGFCVGLIANGARATLAPRWDVLAHEAPKLLNEVLRQYLELTDQGESTDAPRRAIALNHARVRLLDDAQRRVGLHTLAAFELYGLG